MKLTITPEMRVQLAHAETIDISDVVNGYEKQLRQYRKENAELRAHVERLRDCVTLYLVCEAYAGDLREALESTPAQSVAEIQAQGIEEALEVVGDMDMRKGLQRHIKWLRESVK